MKRVLKPIGLILCLGFMASCSKKVGTSIVDPTIVNPVADFKIVADSSDAFTFKFENLSKNYKTLQWRFGDDSVSTEESPTHTYAATSTGGNPYHAILAVTSSTGTVSKKQIDFDLLPDNVMQVQLVPTGVANQNKFVLKIKGTVVKANWSFDEVSPALTTNKKYTDVTPVITQTPGDFNDFTVTATTDKGSSVTISKNVSTAGLAVDITPSRSTYTSNLDNNTNNPNEGKDKLIDGNITTKFGYYAPFPTPLLYALQFPAPVTVTLYGVENGNDTGSGRDPLEWYIEGSNDPGGSNASYVVLDHITLAKGFYDMAIALGLKDTNDINVLNRTYWKFWYYPIPEANRGAYIWYRWRVVKTAGAFQMGEFRLYK
ncbi:hypothetical protein FO440_02345 [Mucilaginibacter corticis]|uniref:PKD domain-containing protein n=1 Tax=Mucilaginibacter corticis TaxID=2597670 RepID=A0A556MSX5_9SPHI|nr:PKD domain-containing protein [Mucilaginibacter corticis]TSJ43051.1 hypothetical protein FO440_02345 [Mucilaginibacter corticis]